MKRLLCTAVSCLLAVTALAQTTVTGPISGFVTLHLTPGTNFLGFALIPAMELQAEATVSGNPRTRLTLKNALTTLTDDQFNTGALPTHVVEIMTGAGQGFTAPVADTSGTNKEIILTEAVPEVVENEVTVKIWKLWTLADVFGASNTVQLTDGESGDTADLIQIPNGTGLDEYFYSSGGALGQGWRKVGAGSADQAAVPLKLNGGIAIHARAAKSVTIVGKVKPGKTMVSLQTGNNFVANLCPVHRSGSEAGQTLGNSGLGQSLASAAASHLADLVLLWNGQGYDQYYFSTGGFPGQGWRQVGQGQANKADTALPEGAFVILRRGAPVQVLLNQGQF
jgi:hypothetical protein